MSQQQGTPGEQQVVIIGPDGQPMAAMPAHSLGLAPGGPGQAQPSADGEREAEQKEKSLTDLVEQPAKVMRIGNMIRQLLEEVKAAPLDEASRTRLREIHQSSITELEQGLAPELVEELQRLTLPFDEASVPTEGELRIAQAQLVGWLEGLFHGIQTAIYAQQVAARAQIEHMRRALPQGLGPGGQLSPGLPPQQPPAGESPGAGESGGMYL